MRKSPIKRHKMTANNQKISRYQNHKRTPGTPKPPRSEDPAPRTIIEGVAVDKDSPQEEVMNAMIHSLPRPVGMNMAVH